MSGDFMRLKFSVQTVFMVGAALMAVLMLCIRSGLI